MSPAGGYAASLILNGSAGVPKGAFYHHEHSFVALLRIDGKKVRKVGETDVGKLAEGIAFSPDGRYLYVGNFVDGDISILRLQGGKLMQVGSLKLAGPPGFAARQHALTAAVSAGSADARAERGDEPPHLGLQSRIADGAVAADQRGDIARIDAPRAYEVGSSARLPAARPRHSPRRRSRAEPRAPARRHRAGWRRCGCRRTRIFAPPGTRRRCGAPARSG